MSYKTILLSSDSKIKTLRDKGIAFGDYRLAGSRENPVLVKFYKINALLKPLCFYDLEADRLVNLLNSVFENTKVKDSVLPILLLEAGIKKFY